MKTFRHLAVVCVCDAHVIPLKLKSVLPGKSSVITTTSQCKRERVPPSGHLGRPGGSNPQNLTRTVHCIEMNN